ncbi:toxin-antitoxin system, toxin component [Streptomyces sp. MMG1533]|nr:toxin-antitoxin system, toxin component [Streptomyces sp. MMG1533]
MATALSRDVIQWQKSTYSGGADGNECVELAHVEDSLLLRESDDPDRILQVTKGGLAALLDQLRLR